MRYVKQYEKNKMCFVQLQIFFVELLQMQKIIFW